MPRRSLKIDFSEVENIRFKCINYCGKCCFYQAPVLTTADINRILKFLESKSDEEYENFILAWTAYPGFDKLNNENFKRYKESLKYFWIPFQMEEAEEGILICNYIIRSMPSTGRCVFLNPINKTCFIYPVRPATCRFYPFSIKINEANTYKIIIAFKNCPGIGIGKPINKEEIKETLQRSLDETQRDFTIYKKYIQDKGIKRIERERIKKIKDIDAALMEFERSWFEQYYLGKKSDVKYGEKMFIEPFAELGLIPPHPIIVSYNNILKINKALS